MKKNIITAIAGTLLLLVSCTPKYETVAGDPMDTKIYTLDNGLKVYMTVNKAEPRLQTYIAVRSGGKNDPADNTGLAHYLEHLMFKGSTKLGTTDYEAEKVYLDQIEELYEVFRTKTDPEERKALYHKIDSLSYLASLISIPNEYDKAMAVIGSQGTNASTSNDVTQYQEDIPSNQIENWAKIQADRFKNMVIRGFHTELETVYEEYNMYLNEDSENLLYAIDSVLFKKHPYGSQSVIGTSDHLKNPSIKAIKRQKSLMYVPNNTAICVSGDFDPDEFVAIIEKYFGDWEPNPEIPVLQYEPEDPITSPVEKHVYGTQAEFVAISWRTPGSKERESEVGQIVESVLNNGMAGLIDVDINQQQLALGASAGIFSRVDYSEFMLEGAPKKGQTLEELRDLLLAEVAKLRAGDFSEDLIEAAIANIKLSDMRSLERNSSRARKFVNSFINQHDWADDVHKTERLSQVTKEDVVAWANKYLSDNSYVIGYKHIGKNPKNEKIEAPKITPIAMNRDKQSDFLAELQASTVKPIEPQFVDYNTDMSRFEMKKGIEVLYKKNEVNDIAQLSFIFNKGLLSDPALSMAFDYITYLGTETRSLQDISMELYKLACNFSTRVGTSNAQFSVSGLSENVGKALEIVEDVILNAVGDEEILAQYKSDLLKSRADTKYNQSSCNSALRTYITYGPEYIRKTTLSDAQIKAISSDELLSKVKSLLGYEHVVTYYGPAGEDEVKALLESSHKAAAELEHLDKLYPEKLETPAPAVYIAPYASRQFNYIQYTCSGEKYNPKDDPQIKLYNEYFGGGMNTVVFQEMREARALAYSANASLRTPSQLNDSYSFNATIGSQNDKLQIAVEAFDEIINNMPQSDKSFEIAKTSMEGVLRTRRVIGSQVLTNYLNDRELGLNEPTDRYVFETIGSLTMDDLVATQQKYVKDRIYTYGLLGDASGMDMNFLRSLGPVKFLTLEDIFGY
ncbi:MAG: insulinase family protein [Rikenellaceae bacterium]|nr:insulinase family protein [Rikenellaceae bacterium]